MFLNSLINRNQQFIQAAVKLHDEGLLEANTYVIDIESVSRNASIIAKKAAECGLTVYAMSKQMGYNPDFQKAVVNAGIGSFVAVDWMGARTMHKQGFKVNHIGHLVQSPQAATQELLNMHPEVFTIFSLQKAAELNAAAKKAGVKQDILLRVFRKTDKFYQGHEGGFLLEDTIDAAREIQKLSNLRIVGTTCFPCMLFDEKAKDVLPTSNFQSAVMGAEKLKKELGIEILQINAPGTTSSDVMERMAKAGATHVEPGHGLTGTTPLATVMETAEKPAVLYLSEVSHFCNGRAHVFGGGLYVDRVRGRYDISVLAGSNLTRASATLIPDDGIDYYCYLDGNVKEGDAVIFGFRPQIFFTRGQVAAIDGVAEGKPRVLGLFDSQGNPVNRSL